MTRSPSTQPSVDVATPRLTVRDRRHFCPRARLREPRRRDRIRAPRTTRPTATTRHRRCHTRTCSAAGRLVRWVPLPTSWLGTAKSRLSIRVVRRCNLPPRRASTAMHLVTHTRTRTDASICPATGRPRRPRLRRRRRTRARARMARPATSRRIHNDRASPLARTAVQVRATTITTFLRRRHSSRRSNSVRTLAAALGTRFSHHTSCPAVRPSTTSPAAYSRRRSRPLRSSGPRRRRRQATSHRRCTSASAVRLSRSRRSRRRL